MMESLYIELRQTYPGNKLHLMLVSPFIVETGIGLVPPRGLEMSSLSSLFTPFSLVVSVGILTPPQRPYRDIRRPSLNLSMKRAADYRPFLHST